MVQHFLEKGHFPDGFRFLVLEIITHITDKGGDILLKLAQQETYWIHRLNTLDPHGLNTNIDFSVYL